MVLSLHVLLHYFQGGHNSLPGWLLSPDWLRPAERAVRHFVIHNPGPGLYLVIFAEEIGIPLPIPGDVAILSAGFLISVGHLPYPIGILAVVGGSITGSYVNFTVNRRYGRRFLKRFGPHFGLDERRLAGVERAFTRWGSWAIIVGRLIPGMRVILSAFAGAFGVPPRRFATSVAISAVIWAVVFLELGRQLGRRTFALFRLVPVHLLPWIAALVVLLVIGHHLLERRRARRRTAGEQTSNLLDF